MGQAAMGVTKDPPRPHDCANRFLALLLQEDTALSRGLADDELGTGLISAIREVDFYFHQTQRHGPTAEREEHMYLLRLGLPLHIRRTFEQVPQFRVPVITFAANVHNKKKALEFLAGFGCIEHGRRMAYASITGDCSVHQVDERTYEFRIPKESQPLEWYEGAVEEHHIGEVHKRISKELQKRLAPTRAQIGDLLRDNVYVFRNRYMGYNAHPTLDEYFLIETLTHLVVMPGVDSFAPDLTFGGVQFKAFVYCAAYFLSLARKHVAFCHALIEKHPDIELEDIITITGPRQDLIETIVEAVNMLGRNEAGFIPIDLNDAEVLFKTFSARRENASFLEGGLMTVPFVVEFSDTALVQSISGAQMDPIGYMLASLRHHWPRDCDKHQRSRESAMQGQLRRTIGTALPWLEFRDNINLRRGHRKLTDIDLAAIDARTGTLILFQLKHQDPYGGDMRKRGSRSSRLLSETRRWVDAVRTWLADADTRELSATFRLPRGTEIQQVRIVAVTRHFAHFLHPLAEEPDFAYATSAQLFDAVMRLETQGDFRTLPGLFGLLRRFMPHLPRDEP